VRSDTRLTFLGVGLAFGESGIPYYRIDFGTPALSARGFLSFWVIIFVSRLMGKFLGTSGLALNELLSVSIEFYGKLKGLLELSVAYVGRACSGAL
jgi:hypothetical protein